METSIFMTSFSNQSIVKKIRVHVTGMIYIFDDNDLLKGIIHEEFGRQTQHNAKQNIENRSGVMKRCPLTALILQRGDNFKLVQSI